jgi:hypothetical protein
MVLEKSYVTMKNLSIIHDWVDLKLFICIIIITISFLGSLTENDDECHWT